MWCGENLAESGGESQKGTQTDGSGTKRKKFDKMVQQAKRQHWRNIQNDLIQKL